MNDYISRQAVLDLIYELQNFYEKEGNESEDFNSKMMYVGSINALTAMEDGLSDIPSADVRPVVYGKWIKIYEDGEPAIEQHQIGVCCSKCMKIPKDRFTESEFCPNCGCYMGGETNG